MTSVDSSTASKKTCRTRRVAVAEKTPPVRGRENGIALQFVLPLITVRLSVLVISIRSVRSRNFFQNSHFMDPYDSMIEESVIQSTEMGQ
jgi:hypothetical protein